MSMGVSVLRIQDGCAQLTKWTLDSLSDARIYTHGTKNGNNKEETKKTGSSEEAAPVYSP